MKIEKTHLDNIHNIACVNILRNVVFGGHYYTHTHGLCHELCLTCYRNNVFVKHFGFQKLFTIVKISYYSTSYKKFLV